MPQRGDCHEPAACRRSPDALPTRAPCGAARPAPRLTSRLCPRRPVSDAVIARGGHRSTELWHGGNHAKKVATLPGRRAPMALCAQRGQPFRRCARCGKDHDGTWINHTNAPWLRVDPSHPEDPRRDYRASATDRPRQIDGPTSVRTCRVVCASVRVDLPQSVLCGYGLSVMFGRTRDGSVLLLLRLVGIESAACDGTGAPDGATVVFWAASACCDAAPPTAWPVRTPAVAASFATTTPAATPPAAAPPAAAPPPDEPPAAVPVDGPVPVAGAGGAGELPPDPPPEPPLASRPPPRLTIHDGRTACAWLPAPGL
jgi:hypothetical protein